MVRQSLQKKMFSIKITDTENTECLRFSKPFFHIVKPEIFLPTGVLEEMIS